MAAVVEGFVVQLVVVAQIVVAVDRLVSVVVVVVVEVIFDREAAKRVDYRNDVVGVAAVVVAVAATADELGSVVVH